MEIHIEDYARELHATSPNMIETIILVSMGGREILFRVQFNHKLIPQIEIPIPYTGMVDPIELDKKIYGLLQELNLPEELQKRLNIYEDLDKSSLDEVLNELGISKHAPNWTSELYCTNDICEIAREKIPFYATPNMLKECKCKIHCHKCRTLLEIIPPLTDEQKQDIE